MATIPPAGIAPTMPPSPKNRGGRAVVLAGLGLALLVAALAWRVAARPDSAAVFAYDNDAQLGEVFRRLLYLTSALMQIGALLDAKASFQDARGLSLAAFGLSSGWLAAVVWGLVAG